MVARNGAISGQNALAPARHASTSVPGQSASAARDSDQTTAARGVASPGRQPIGSTPAILSALHHPVRRALFPRRVTRPEGIKHRQPDRLHHQPRADRLRRRKPFGQRDLMPGLRQQRRRQPANPCTDNPDLHGTPPQLTLRAGRGGIKPQPAEFRTVRGGIAPLCCRERAANRPGGT